MFKLDLEKAEEPEIKLPSVGSSKQESSRNISTSSLLIVPKPMTIWITTNFGKLLKRWEYQTTLCASCLLRNLYAGQEATVRIGHEQQTGSKLGKGYVMAVYCHPAYLTSMQRTS